MRRGLVLLFLLWSAPAWAQTNFFSLQDWRSDVPEDFYTNGSLVKFNGTSWICSHMTSCPVSAGDPSVNHQWNALSGLLAWDSGVSYSPNDMIMRNGTTFSALAPNSNVDPAGGAFPTVWRARGVPNAVTFVPAGATNVSPTFQIQAAFDATPAGGIVQFDCAAFSLSSVITVSKTLTVRGCGMNSTVLNTTTRAFSFTSASRSSVSDLAIKGGSGDGIDVDLSDFFRIQNVYFQNQGNGVSFTSTAYAWVVNSHFENGGFGVSVDYTSTPDAGDGTMYGNVFVGQTVANIRVTNSGGWRIENNKLLQSSGTDLIVTATAASFSTGVYIIGNSIENCSVACISITGSAPGSVTVPVIVGNEISPLASAPAITVSGNAFSGVISGNNIVPISGTGVNIGSGASDWVVVGNTIVGASSGGTGISVASSVTGTKITGNSFNALVTTRYSLSTSGTLISDNSGFVFSGLPSSAADGSMVWCSNCSLTGNMSMCSASGGTVGTMATRISGSWRCQ
jgi:hypothetical protein